ncbi:iron-containing alcohol dehydrogenase family protein [Maledivibacter halophilus]|uniref:Glycerol dehydrogenase n=1 Tax=Maledivibacter halophilus TaxID=36842 RepID=A0A1T5IND7_9FIRM|nr:iron-containing alcohol dehydrogenase family protein [Maledivibacter halophilus]SKC40649.1 glycerol dehydrogenase [Maledivibacter halophilus]
MGKLTVTFPNYTIGEDSLQDLVGVCTNYGNRILIVGGKTALQKASPKIENSIKDSNLEIVDYIWYGGECTYDNMNLVAKKARENKVHMIIGVGGGKAIDTAKGAADKIDIPVFTVPTIAATCAATTSLSVVYNENGEFNSFYFLKKPPVHIFMDSEIIARAPVKYLWAGIGDTIAKYYECTLASRGDVLDHSSGLGREISAMCVKPMFQYAEKALGDCEKSISSFEIEQVILNNVVSTGLVSMLVEDKYNGALAHSIFYGLTILDHIEKNHLHGEVVAYGVLVQLAIDNQEEELKKLYDFYKKIKLPTSLEDIEVKNDRKYLNKVLENTVIGPDMEYLPYEVTKDMVFEGIQKLEKLNGKM